MSGHSKWANIKHRKGAADKKRGTLFTKLARAITIAAREGGGDPAGNVTLRLAIDKARAANMPKDNIERAIARGTGGDRGAQLERVLYEGYGPHGVAILAAATTDNRNRTVSEVRHVFNKHGGSLGENGSVAWQFVQRGMISVPAAGVDGDELALEAIDAGAIDVELDSELVTVYTAVEDFRRIQDALTAGGYDTTEAELTMLPTVQVDLGDKATLQVLRFVDALEELEDVDEVWTNVSISDAVAEQFAAA
jgi:YebC/PmpR family DNA-binding regulatory protein